MSDTSTPSPINTQQDEEKTLQLPVSESPVLDSALPPEGGLRGWLCCVGGSLGLFATLGFLNALSPLLPQNRLMAGPFTNLYSIGIFQTTYQNTLLKDYSSSKISWIFTIQLSLIWAPGSLFGRIVDTYGPRPVLIPCTFLCVFSLCMTSLSTKYYQIILAQGIGYGLGAGGIFTTCLVCVSQWFVKQRGLALGITVAGSSIGEEQNILVVSIPY